jgi:aldehyde dehydrogenase (NAD+)
VHDEQDEVLNPANAAKAFDQVYINGRFVIPHGRQLSDLANPTNDEAFGKVTLADEIDTRNAVAAAKEAFRAFSPAIG